MYNLRSSCRIAALFWKHIRYFRAKFPPKVYFVKFRIFAIFALDSPPEVYFKTFRIFVIFTPNSRRKFISWPFAYSLFFDKVPPAVYFGKSRIFAIFTTSFRLRFYGNFYNVQIFTNFFSDYFYLARYLLYI